jgi:orotate phosphoribosyltransferase-like protein
MEIENFSKFFWSRLLVFGTKCGKKMKIFAFDLIFGAQVAGFGNITMVANIIEKKGAYFMPVDATEDGTEEQGKDYTAVSDNGSQVINGITNSDQN